MNVLKLLTQPSDEIKNPETRRRARVLSIVLLVHLGICLVSFLLMKLVEDSVPTPNAEKLFWAIALAILMDSIAYALSRTRHLAISSMVFYFGVAAGVILSMVISPDPTVVSASVPYLLLPLIVASLFASLGQMVFLSLAATLSVVWIPYHLDLPGASFVMPLVFLVSGSLILMVVRQLQLRDLAELGSERAKSVHSARLATLGEVSAGVAHEINNPLMVIHSLARRMIKSQDPEKVVEASKRILAMAERIGVIIKNLRNFAREGGHDPVEVLDLKKIMDDSLGLCRERFQRKGVEIKVVTPEEPVMIRGKNVELSQVLVNLLNNAFDAIKTQDRPWIQVSLRVEKSWAELSVKDSGLGISNELKKKVFQPFFTTKGANEGTGLGLSISKGIIENHKGMLLLDPHSENTTFICRLPLESQEKTLNSPTKSVV